MQPSKTKSELIDAVAASAHVPRGRAEQVVNRIFDALSDALARGEGVELRGFGTFSVRDYPAYDGRNPRTGEPVHVKPKRLPVFKVGKELRQRVEAAGEAQASRRAQAEAARAEPATLEVVAREAGSTPRSELPRS